MIEGLHLNIRYEVTMDKLKASYSIQLLSKKKKKNEPRIMKAAIFYSCLYEQKHSDKNQCQQNYDKFSEVLWKSSVLEHSPW